MHLTFGVDIGLTNTNVIASIGCVQASKGLEKKGAKLLSLEASAQAKASQAEARMEAKAAAKRKRQEEKQAEKAEMKRWVHQGISI